VTVLLVVSYLVGLTVTSLTIYTATVEKSRDYGVLKAIGASNRYVYSMVIYQSFIVSLVGFLTGAPLSILASRIAQQQVAEFITIYSWSGLMIAFVAVLAMSILAALLPAHKVGRIEPAIVFRA
jgi:putative ABC transport system permease protein